MRKKRRGGEEEGIKKRGRRREREKEKGKMRKCQRWKIS